MTTWTPQYSSWRHGGWYVDNVRYPSGAVGCVSRNYPDRKWRIVCDNRAGDHTYPSRDAAATAEYILAKETPCPCKGRTHVVCRPGWTPIDWPLKPCVQCRNDEAVHYHLVPLASPAGEHP